MLCVDEQQLEQALHEVGDRLPEDPGGFHVDSMATWVHPALVSQSASARRSGVLAPKVRIIFSAGPVGAVEMRQATTLRLCPSRPQQHGCSTSMTSLLTLHTAAQGRRPQTELMELLEGGSQRGRPEKE
jgi:hypothetical protein